jgi:hypothetical protein
MTEVKVIPMVETLKRDNAKIQNDRAERIGVELKEAHFSLLLEKRSEIRQLNNKLAAMTDLSASNNAMDVNAIKDIDAQQFVKDYQRINEQIKNKTLLYEIAVKVGTELYGIDMNNI